ncbi:MAG: primosomal protein N', partial [Ignavibacteriales bacterium]|nr:primosomal protein N' [Ignavibacteriales bacterium]
AIPLAIDKLFTYTVPQELHNAAKRGVRVIAPFGKRKVIGFIIDVKEKSNVSNLRQIIDIIDDIPLVPDDLLQLTMWIADYYFAPLGEVLKSALLYGALKTGKKFVSLLSKDIDTWIKNNRPSQKQTTILQALHPSKKITVQQIQKRLKLGTVYTHLNQLANRGAIKIEEEPFKPLFKPKHEIVIELDRQSLDTWQTWLKELYSRSSKRYIKQVAVIQALLQLDPDDQSISVQDLLKRTGISISTIKSLERNKILKLSKREVIRTPEYDLYESALGSTNFKLNSHQDNALKALIEQIEKNTFHTFLLHGVTGSGKTQVYIEAIKEVLGRGKTAIVLVPEISLTPQIVRRFKFHLGENVVVIHSRMSGGERYDSWRMAWKGKCSVIIGPRSAIFAPLKNIGLIVVDEEHESSYKQFDQTPRYNARDVAIMRALYCNAAIVLGSATPSIESYSNALNGKYTLLELPERVDNVMMPPVEIIDMTEERAKKLDIHRAKRREEFKKDKVKAKLEKRKFEFSSISDAVRKKIEDKLEKKEGIILLQNRRGFSLFIECPDCGYVEMCDNCNISLTYHATKDHLRCHYCGLIKQVPIFCPKSQSIDIQYRGFGTQRVEEEIEKLFPSVKLLRMDLDTTATRGAHDRILKQFSECEADILLGTQMVAKGLDFSRVTLVGVISADTQMLLPDFRSVERTFQLLTQVAGRAGRSNLGGDVIIQTYQAKHPVLQYVVTHDYKGFYQEEISYRHELNYPPYSRLILVEFKGVNGNDVIGHAQKFVELLRKHNSHFIILGPAPAALVKLKGYFRWHVIIKSIKTKDPSGKTIHIALKQAIELYRNSPVGKTKSVKVIIDVDPVGMM